ncbi:hypothetical protein LRC537489_30660 [Mycobacterium riyadhense]
MARVLEGTVGCGKLAKAQQLLHSQEEAGTADSTHQNSDLHIAGQYLPAMRGRPARVRRRKTRRRPTTTESPKFDHEMIWKCRGMLDPAGEAVSNHISVISRLAGRFRCRRPRFDHLFELG